MALTIVAIWGVLLSIAVWMEQRQPTQQPIDSEDDQRMAASFAAFDAQGYAEGCETTWSSGTTAQWSRGTSTPAGDGAKASSYRTKLRVVK